MSAIIIILIAIFGVPFLMLTCLMIILSSATKEAEKTFKTLSTSQKQEIASDDTVYKKNLFKAYVSKKTLSKIIVKNMCNKEMTEKSESDSKEK